MSLRRDDYERINGKLKVGWVKIKRGMLGGGGGENRRTRADKREEWWAKLMIELGML